MYPQHRLRTREDFQRLRQHGRVQHHRLITMSYLPNDLMFNRYGFIVSKQLGKAVRRNRMRRLLREAVRLLHPQLQAGHDVAVIARAPLAQQPFEVVQRTLNEMFHRAGLLGPE